MSGARAHQADTAAEWSATTVADFDRVCAAAGCATARDEGLGRHTSMGVGGPTPVMVWPRHPDAIALALEWCAARGLGWRILGGGSNVLVADAGVSEPVLNLTELTEGTRIEAPTTILAAGTPTAQALKATMSRGLRGLLWATGLPGTIGGAAAGNAGCWGGQMADIVTRLDVVDASGAWTTLGATELSWGYRSTPLPESMHNGAVIVAVTINTRPQDPEKLRQRFDELHAAKRERQPIGARNAGRRPQRRLHLQEPRPHARLRPAHRRSRMQGHAGWRCRDFGAPRQLPHQSRRRHGGRCRRAHQQGQAGRPRALRDGTRRGDPPMVNDQFRRGSGTVRRSRGAYYTRRRRHRLGATSTGTGFKIISPQFMRRVRNRPALRRRGYLHAMIRPVVALGGVAALVYGAQFGYQKALTSPALSIQSVRLHQVPTMS